MAGQTLSPEELSALAAQHGGLAGAKQGPAKKIPDPDFPGNSRLATEDPNPDIKYTFGDGSYLTAHFDPTAGTSGGWSVTDPGTALKPTPGPKTTVSGASTSDKYIIQTDPATGELKPVANPNYVPPTATAAAQPKVVVSGSNTNDSTIVTFDPATGEMTTKPNPNYVNPTSIPLTPAEQQTLAINKQNADTAAQNTKLQAARDGVDAQYKALSNQVAMGQLSNAQAIQQFQEVVDQFNAQKEMLTAADTAGQNAAKYAQMTTANEVGPNFGANFARGLQGVRSGNPSLVNYGANDFTYQTPDYAGLAAKASAAVLARLAPYAARLGQTSYQPQAPTQGPSVLGQAAQSVVAAPQGTPYQPQNRQ